MHSDCNGEVPNGVTNSNVDDPILHDYYLRMQSTTEANVRVLAEDTALMGYHIPAEVYIILSKMSDLYNYYHALCVLQTNVFYLSFIAAKNEQLFPNADKFDPARWARDKPNPFAVLPFGFGPRSCYGMNRMYAH